MEEEDFFLRFKVKVCYFGCFDEKSTFEKSCINLMLKKDQATTSQYLNSYKNLDFIFGGDPASKADFYVIINYPPPNFFYEPSKTIVIHNEPWCFEKYQTYGVKTWNPEWRLPSPQNFFKVHSPVAACNLGLVQWMFEFTPQELAATDFSSKKEKLISCIISNKNFDPGHIARNNFIRKYKNHLFKEDGSNSFKIDVYGRNTELSDNQNLSNEEKYTAIAPYKYFIAVENNKEPNYITEKLFEGIVCECLVFYDGAPNAASHVDPRSFIPINIASDGLEATFNKILTAIEDDEYEKRLPFIKEEKLRIITELSLFPMLHNTILDNYYIKLENIDQFNNDVGFFPKENLQFKLKEGKMSVFNSAGFVKKNSIECLTPVANIDLYVTVDTLLKHFKTNVFPKFDYSNKIIRVEYDYFVKSIMKKEEDDNDTVVCVPFPWETFKISPYSLPSFDFFVYNYFIPLVSMCYKQLKNVRFETVIQGDSYIDHFEFLNSLKVPFDVYIVQKSRKDTLFYEAKYPNLKLKPYLYDAVNLETPVRAPFFIKFLNLSPPLERKYLFSFVGAYQPAQYISTLRKEVFNAFENHPLNTKEFYVKNIGGFHYNTQLFNTNEKTPHQLQQEMETYNEVLFSSVFSLCLPGTGSNSMRLSESLAAGTIPVIFNRIDDPVVDVPPNDCIITIDLDCPSTQISDIYEILLNIKKTIDVGTISKKCIELYKNRKKKRLN